MTATVSGWAEALAHHAPPAMDATVGRLVAVAAHPDDETLAAAGFLRAVHATGGTVELVVATDGEAAFPDAPAADRAALGRTRRAELHAALEALGLPETRVSWLGLPDSGLADHEEELTSALAPLLRPADTCLAPWSGDPHPDHAAAGRAAERAAPVGAHRFAYPIWMWPWLRPDDPTIPWQAAREHRLDEPARRAKAVAIERFASQLAPAPDGGAPILPPDVLAHFATGRELFFRVPRPDSAPAERFADLYADGADPWGTRTSWYEERKRSVVAACLPHRHYAHAAEPGCGLGGLTRVLAGRCGAVTASDYTPAAVAATREATGGFPGVSVLEAALPDPRTVPAGVDLVVLSEVLYYLSPTDVGAVADRVAHALVAGGDVLLAHWRGWPAEAPQDAAATHGRLLDDPRFDLLVEHVDEEFLLHVLRRS
ncbi:bifunctional PIG-L family deacetylase/class I SAM-dependent methyltransferase [Pseudonocardia sp. RS010]|uniref:bifunctional PIG-L family deacetylase/class I SAM-dependent methyltransferase n=1 Tax=Pseudonocardia sp. RS010 TaxID=3385979 RepID=UPI00399F7566